VKLLKLGATEGETCKVKFAATTWFCVNTVPAWFHDSVSHWETKCLSMFFESFWIVLYF
jgi:hypothetical protein